MYIPRKAGLSEHAVVSVFPEYLEISFAIPLVVFNAVHPSSNIVAEATKAAGKISALFNYINTTLLA